MVQKLIEGRGKQKTETHQSGWPASKLGTWNALYNVKECQPFGNASKLGTWNALHNVKECQPFGNVQFCPVTRVVM